MLKPRTALILFFSFLALNFPRGELWAQDFVLTLEEACGRALEADRALQKAALDLGLARTKANSAWAEFFPTLNAGAGLDYGIPLSGPGGEPGYSASARLSLGFNTGLPLTLKNNNLEYLIRLADYEAGRLDRITETSKTFYSLLAQEKNLEVLDGARRLAEEQLQRDRVARQSGYLGELDFLSSSLSAETAKLDYSGALSEYLTALGEFLVGLGLDQRGGVKLEGTIEVSRFTGKAEELIGAALPRRLDLRTQRYEIERLQNAEALAGRAAKGPSLDLSASWGLSPSGFDKAIGTGLSLTLPLDPWVPNSKRHQVLKSAAVEVEKGRLDLKEKEDAARTTIRSLVLSLENGWNEIETARLRVSIAQRAYELSEQGYRRGSLNFLDFETARNRLTSARQQQLQSEIKYKLLFLDLAKALNSGEAELNEAGKGE
ncbi:MAG: TolC family protein [Treponema sp.]|jgi:outer membrane protein TolC|nr:TolC family protein [Treponema sp.]